MIRPPTATDLVSTGARLASAALVLAASLHARPASAQTDEGSRALAEQLFMEGRTLTQQGKHAEACAKFKKAHDLDRTATGTLLNLALCHEATNKTASAWAEFRQVAAESARRPDRIALAREHEDKLYPILSRLAVDVPLDARVKGLEVRIDGREPLGPEAWGVALPVDPGEHIVEVTAPGKVAWKKDVVLGATSDRGVVVVPILVDAPVEPTRGASPWRSDTSRAEEGSRSTRRTIGVVLAGAGLAAIGAGLVLGKVASDSNDDANALCPDTRCASQAAKDDASRTLASADRSATAANVLAGLGGAAIVGGAVLYISAWPRAPRVRAQAGASRASLVFEGTF